MTHRDQYWTACGPGVRDDGDPARRTPRLRGPARAVLHPGEPRAVLGTRRVVPARQHRPARAQRAPRAVLRVRAAGPVPVPLSRGDRYVPHRCLCPAQQPVRRSRRGRVRPRRVPYDPRQLPARTARPRAGVRAAARGEPRPDVGHGPRRPRHHPRATDLARPRRAHRARRRRSALVAAVRRSISRRQPVAAGPTDPKQKADTR